MRAYNVDAEDDYEFHRQEPRAVTGEYRASGSNVYRGYTVNDSSTSNSSSRRTYTTPSNSGSAGGGRGSLISYGSSGGGGSNNSNINSGSSASHNGGYVSQHSQHASAHRAVYGGGGGDARMGVALTPSSITDKSPHVGDARYAAAQAVVGAALGHSSGGTSMLASTHTKAGYGNFGIYHQQQASTVSGAGHYIHSHPHPHPHPHPHHPLHRASGASGSITSGPGGGPPRYSPSSISSSHHNGETGGTGSSTAGYHAHAGSSGKADAASGSHSGSQPRSLVRSSGEYVPLAGSRGRSSSAQPVSTILGGGYHNYAVPPGSMPLGGGGVGGLVGGGELGSGPFVHRSISHGRGDDSRESRDRDIHGGRGGKRGRW